MPIEHNPDYIHHQDSGISSTIREVVFGMEDGMVSTLGSITGIAAATTDPFTVVLAGVVIICVESISMAVGSYLSSKSEKEIDEHKLHEERIEIEKFPDEEEEELVEMYVAAGWPQDLATTMAATAKANPDIMLQEMAFRELEVIPGGLENPLKNGVYMFVSYVIGGMIPLAPYLLLPLETAFPLSIVVTLIGLFALGAYTTKFSKRQWWKSGVEMFVLATFAALVGFGAGQLVDQVWAK